ncbi:chromosome segregation protein SMC [Chelatococcus sambhunathii]|uniref:Chromosome partition protein Smc n=1 Tax=Chelatococcus sambhunathii TaxID=363953 RepID=A0ABU1DIP1_9HYPH|nr:chromosome segregation protein SMC [Chelatococcus sambhunathii]MDR4307864.1 chromosome segregation protein SMC [Chelatococcus sambhunathii]
MNFTRLRLAGFKTFVDPVDAPIEPGLTGIVGPNGCGKSNLVEALRWVMGESSFKSLRASGMEDVIFAGSSSRPARNHAEVSLTLDNASGRAPAPYEAAAEIEVSRKISRGLGSAYRINGREVRARDVQLLFADASSGARSPSMVGQGRVGEIINARPDQRRRILEEAAGIAGLHQRRREAEQRLEGAEQNLARVEDVLGQLAGRIEGLKKQARSAERYRQLSEEIQTAEGLSLLARHAADAAGTQSAETAETEALAAVAEATRLQGEAARAEAVSAHALEPARHAAAEAEAALRRIALKAGELEGEEGRARARLAELAARLAQIEGDVAREGGLGEDAAAALARVEAALAEFSDAAATPSDEAERAALSEAEQAVAKHEAALAEATEAQAARVAERRDLERRRQEQGDRIARLNLEAAGLASEAAALNLEASRNGDVDALGARFDAERARSRDADRAVEAAEAAHAAARAAEAQARRPAGEATSRAERALAEARALAKLVADVPGRAYPPAVELLVVDPGYEVALGAALGDDLDAAVDARAPAHWAATEAAGDPPLPAGIDTLAEHVVAPAELSRRLAQIGVVARADGPRLRAMLKPGQRLVSREGDLWRWDGLTLGADAPTPAARRLAEKNRLGAVERAAAEASAERDRLRAAAETARAKAAQAANAERSAREEAKARRAAVETAREAHVAAERAVARVAARLSAVEEARARIAAQLDEARAAAGEVETRLGALPEPGADIDLSELKAAVAQARREAAERRASLEARAAEARRRAARLKELHAEREAWRRRREGATARLADLASRRTEAEAERLRLAERPDELAAERIRLRVTLDGAEKSARAAAEAFTAAESLHREAERAARTCLDRLSQAREAAARAGAKLEAAREKASAAAQRIMEARGLTPGELAASLAGVPRETSEEIEARLSRALAARERLGPVNLRAEQDLAEAEEATKTLSAEREDLTEAIARLRAAVRSLNSEGRGRLLSAFERVDANFRTLFQKLFEGGEARLELVESDDPLEAGLEVIARPPGKKPQTLSLLSGGEQALTALALVFAVFLTNPAPVCVLDEVDAPLDDANVERFCALLADMSSITTTRFLTVTHNPITMAHMDRLLGVTMSERGVSQLVSVDLQTAERLAEAV